MQRGVHIDEEWGWLISIGELAILAPRVMVFAHDASMRRALGYTKIAPVHIGDRAYIGAGSIVLPGVTVGDDAIVGAGSVVSRSIPAASLAVGNPARVLCESHDFLDRRQQQLEQGPVFDDLRDWRDDAAWPELREDVGRQVRERGLGWVR